MSIKQKTVRVGVVQAAPVIMDAEATLSKALGLIQEAADKGCELIMFPESFIPCYPKAISFGSVIGWRTPAGRRDWRRYYENSVDVPGPITEKLSKAAKQHSIYLSIGVMERGSGSIFVVSYFWTRWRVSRKHRKVKPTAGERVVWGEGDGSTLTTVDAPFGTFGAVICWENYMPLMRAAMYSKGIHIYLAPTADYRETWLCSMRHIAREGGCFVLSCNMCFTVNDYPDHLETVVPEKDIPDGIVHDGIMTNGGSAIISPFGDYLAGPVYDKEEILVADLDMDMIPEARLDFDPVGHYSRPDIFKLTVNEEELKSATWVNGAEKI